MKSKTNKKIIFFMTSLQMGGGERVCVDLMNALVDSGDHVSLAVMKYEGFYKETLSSNIEVIDFQSKSIIGSFFKFLFLVYKKRPDIIFSSYIHLNPFIIVVGILSFKKIKSIIRIGNPLSLSFKTYSSFKDRILLKILTKLTYKKADTIISVSKSIAEDTKKFLQHDGANIQVIYSPKNYQEIKIQGEAYVPEVFLNRKEKTFLFIGRLVEQKDPETLIRALQFLKNKDFHVIFVGGGGKEDSLKKLAKELEVFDRVSFEGSQNNPYVYMKNVDALILPSRWEGMPNVLLESFAFGVPIIASDCFPGSNREFLAPETDISHQITDSIEETPKGFLFPVGDFRMLARAMESVLSRPRNSRFMVRNENIRSTIQEYKEVFKI